MDSVNNFLKSNPHYFGIFFALIGVVGLLSAIYDWKWLFEKDVSTVTYNLKKIDGWINFFGRKTARIFVGVSSVIVIIAGIFWFWAYAFYYK